MRILVLADTHIPIAAEDIPSAIYKIIDSIDLILHAGDILEEAFLEKLSSHKEVKAVKGNMDSDVLRNTLPDKGIINVGKFKIGLIHGSGSPQTIVERIKNEFKGVDAIVFGHTHNAFNQVKDNILFFNPGSPTDKVFALFNSYGILEVNSKITGEIIRF